jgi:hypothetical protein
MVLTQDLALPLFFRELTVLGAEHLPLEGPVLLAPTHRSRWDALLLPHAAGRRRTGRDCRFMVSIDEMAGLQGWFLQRLGCFPVNPRRPGPSSLRLAVELLQAHQQLVVFPEGRIQQVDEPLRLMPGLARLTQLALAQDVPVQVLPVGTLRTIVSQIKTVRVGDSVGYSRRGVLDHDARIATLAIGYADGYDRRFGNGVGEVWVNGTLCPTVGNVCMDMTMIDVTEATVSEGDEVEIFGQNVSVSELAKRIDTIPYELLTSVSERVKRVFYTE